jgi:LCP family protein required for cell wall assembly
MDETRVFQRSDIPKPRKRWPRILGFVVLALALFSVGLVFGFYKYMTGLSELDMELGADLTGRINILVLGVDAGVNGTRTNEWTRSDVNMVVSIDPITKDAAIVSIPRDTRVFIPGKIAEYSKMGHAHAYGGPNLTIETVEQFLEIDIDYYARADFEAFKRAVNALGGVDMDIPEDMHYEDPYQNLYIDFKKGPTHLDGDRALELVRYRGYTDADIGRIRVQEAFLKALIKKAVSLSGIIKIPALYEELAPYIKTDLTGPEIIELANIARGIDPDNVKMGMVPGIDKYITDNGVELSYWVPDGEKTAQMVNDLIKGISRERNAAVTIAVENGSGVPGVADGLASILRGYGFQVVSVGNASKQDYAATRVVARSADQVAQALVLRSVRQHCSDAQPYNGTSIPEEAQVLVIVGPDYGRPTE